MELVLVGTSVRGSLNTIAHEKFVDTPTGVFDAHASAEEGIERWKPFHLLMVQHSTSKRFDTMKFWAISSHENLVRSPLRLAMEYSILSPDIVPNEVVPAQNRQLGFQ